MPNPRRAGEHPPHHGTPQATAVRDVPSVLHPPRQLWTACCGKSASRARLHTRREVGPFERGGGGGGGEGTPQPSLTAHLQCTGSVGPAGPALVHERRIRAERVRVRREACLARHRTNVLQQRLQIYVHQLAVAPTCNLKGKNDMKEMALDAWGAEVAATAAEMGSGCSFARRFRAVGGGGG
jgi:hypothetical protein